MEDSRYQKGSNQGGNSPSWNTLTVISEKNGNFTYVLRECFNPNTNLPLWAPTNSLCVVFFFSIVSLLIKVTSKYRVNRSGVSPLHLAAECNRDAVVEVLIEAGYDVNAMLSDDRSMMYEDHRSTTLYFAVANGNVEATTMLLEAGAIPNLDTFNPLLVALRQGSIELVTLLVEHGANVNAYVPTHPTSFPATLIFGMKYLSMLKYLMDNGCDALSCFSCTYGSGPHPPHQETSERDDLRYNTNTCRSTGEPVQVNKITMKCLVCASV